jgi:hypothetical protein
VSPIAERRRMQTELGTEVNAEDITR